MKGAVFAAIAAAVGNLLQGWDNATIAGALMYIKREFNLETQPTLEGLIVAMSLIGSTVITTFSGPASDSLGRRPMLIISSLLIFLSGLVMFWSPNVYILLLGRLLDGFGVGLVVTLVPIYISETSPSEIRGQLNTLPQFTSSTGMLMSYCMIFGMSLTESPSWRLMLGFLSIPSLLYLALAVFYLPESPRWLVSKGRMEDAKKVLQKLRGREDVTGEMALLVEGLGSGGDTSVEEYMIGPGNDEEATRDKNQIKLYGAEQGQSWIAKPVTGQSMLGMASRYGSIAPHSIAPQGSIPHVIAPQGSMANMMDPLVTLFGSVHEKMPTTATGSMRSSFFPYSGSMFGAAAGEEHEKHGNWEAGSQGDDSGSDAGNADSDDNLHSPLLSRHGSGMDKNVIPLSNANLIQASNDELVNSTGIGGGWQLAYRRTEKKGHDGKSELRRLYLHQQPGPGMGSMRASMRGSVFSMNAEIPDGQFVQAAGLVSQSALNIKNFKGDSPLENGVVQPSPSATKPTGWRELFEPGVKHALIVGMGLQILQQFSGINGVLYFTPQILQQAGVDVLLSSIGISGDSASLLISGVTTLLMLPSIGFAMRVMDVAGRRFLLLNTLPVVLLSLVLLVLSNVISMGTMLHATMSTLSLVLYFCFFVMGFGPIPNILCSEIFPTRVRGLCIALCALTAWVGDIIVTYSLPGMLTSMGVAGVFGIYGVVCTISWFFVYFKVPETKGMPLEVISEFFNMGARQNKAAAKNI